MALHGGRLQGWRHHRRHGHEARNFGAFVRVRDGLDGLIHISELSHQRVAHPGDVVHEGQTLKLKIISLDSERHRLGLSLKQAEDAAAPRPAPVESAPSSAPVSSAPANREPRPERRPRPERGERGYSMADAVQEPEGGIDNTLAAAFAQVRQQMAAAEAEDVTATIAADEAEEESAAAEAIDEITAAVAADEADIESAAAEELAGIDDAAAANDANEAPAAAAAEDVAESVTEAEAAEEGVASEGVAEILETVAADEATEEAAAADAIKEIARETMEENTKG